MPGRNLRILDTSKNPKTEYCGENPHTSFMKIVRRIQNWLPYDWSWPEIQGWTHDRLINPWYYPIRNFIWPHNVQKIRNCPRSWNDRSERVIHCVFSMLSDFIEKECGGIEEFRKQVKAGLAQKGQPDYWVGYETEADMVDLYEWYHGVNWKDPIPPINGVRTTQREDAFYELCVEKTKKAIETSPRWWT